jgi:hypothetical protein
MWAYLGWNLLGLAFGTIIISAFGWLYLWYEDRKRDIEWARLCKEEWGIPNKGWRTKPNNK